MTEWVHKAVQKINADMQRSSDTHLLELPLPGIKGIRLYFKDESTHPTGSLKHRLARSLFLYGLCNGKIKQNTTVIEASSGSTAISEAYFARLLGLPFIAVVPEKTSSEKIREIEFYGGKCQKVCGSNIYAEAERLAEAPNTIYLDQFTYAERATDWRGNNNIAESIFKQLALEPHPIPDWIVVGAGTGGTSATIGRYIRYQRHHTRLCVADPQHSVFHKFYETGDQAVTCDQASSIEGIGRPRVEPSFIPEVIDEMVVVPDAASFAGIHVLQAQLNRECGGSTGTNLIASLQCVEAMRQSGKSGAVVSMICDSGERYRDTYYNRDWLNENGFLNDMETYQKKISDYIERGQFPDCQFQLESHS